MIINLVFGQVILTYYSSGRHLSTRDTYQVDVIVLDFSKAFDTVPHQRLLKKLHTMVLVLMVEYMVNSETVLGPLCF